MKAQTQIGWICRTWTQTSKKGWMCEFDRFDSREEAKNTAGTM